MHDLLLAYGHHGNQAINGPHVAELLERTAEGQFGATERFDDHLRQLTNRRLTPYSLSPDEMQALHATWRASILWQIASSFLDGIVAMHEEDEPDIPVDLYQRGDQLADTAADATICAIEHISAVEHRLRMPTSKPDTQPPRFFIEPTTTAGIWQSYEAVIIDVERLIETMATAQVPVRMVPLHAETIAVFRQQQQMFRFLRKQWASSRTIDNDLQALNKALPVVTTIYEIGAKLVHPRLHGKAYDIAEKRKLRLDELELGFDIWILTDPELKAAKHTPESLQELADFWHAVTDPQGVLALVSFMQDLSMRDVIRRRIGRGYAVVPPWPSQFLVRFGFSSGATRFNPGDLITYYPRRRDGDQITVELRRTGRVSGSLELLGQTEK